MQISKQSTQNRCPKKYIETGTFQRPIFQWCADQKTQNRTLYSVRDFAFFGPRFKRAALKNWPQSEIVRKRLRETPFAGEGKLKRVFGIPILHCSVYGIARMPRRHRPRVDATLTVRDTVCGWLGREWGGGKLLPSECAPSSNYLFHKSRDAILRVAVAEKDVKNRNS